MPDENWETSRSAAHPLTASVVAPTTRRDTGMNEISWALALTAAEAEVARQDTRRADGIRAAREAAYTRRAARAARAQARRRARDEARAARHARGVWPAVDHPA